MLGGTAILVLHDVSDLLPCTGLANVFIEVVDA